MPQFTVINAPNFPAIPKVDSTRSEVFVALTFARRLVLIGGTLAVSEHYQTTVPHVYAAGDVGGWPALASTSREQARAAMAHAFEHSQR